MIFKLSQNFLLLRFGDFFTVQFIRILVHHVRIKGYVNCHPILFRLVS